MSERSAMRSGGAPLGERALAAGGLAFELAKKWWVLLLRGILLIFIGLLAFVSPLVWVTFVGIYILVDGVTMLMSGFSDQPAGQSHWPLIILGVLGLIAGLIILWNPALGAITLTTIIAVWAVIGGILIFPPVGGGFCGCGLGRGRGVPRGAGGALRRKNPPLESDPRPGALRA